MPGIDKKHEDDFDDNDVDLETWLRQGDENLRAAIEQTGNTKRDLGDVKRRSRELGAPESNDN